MFVNPILARTSHLGMSDHRWMDPDASTAIEGPRTRTRLRKGLPMPFKRIPGTNNFHEVQHFNQWWVLAVVAGLAVAGWWAFIEQIVLRQPWGNRPAPDGVVVLMWLVFGIGVPAMMRWVRLIVRVTDDALDIRYVPFRHRVIPLSTITSAEPRTYRPMREYFGWGIRWMPLRGWVYSVSGDQGVQLVLGRRRRLLIGSRKPFELAAAITMNQRPGSDMPNGGHTPREHDHYREHTFPSENEALFETVPENGQWEAGDQAGPISEPTAVPIQRSESGKGNANGTQKKANWRARLPGVRLAFLPALGMAARWIQAMARRLGASERLQRFAADSKARAAAAANSAAQAGRHVALSAARAGERARDNATLRFRDVRMPSRVAAPAMRYMRNPQLIVDDFRKTG